MDKLFDEISRMLASPVPRRKALRLFAGGVASALVVAFMPMRGDAFDNCGTGQNACGTTPSGSTRCCTSSQTCCDNLVCCTSTETCNHTTHKCVKKKPSPTAP